MKAIVCVLNGKFDNGVSFNVNKLHSILLLAWVLTNSIRETPIVMVDDTMIPTNNKNPESSPEKREEITKKATIINGIIL